MTPKRSSESSSAAVSASLACRLTERTRRCFNCCVAALPWFQQPCVARPTLAVLTRVLLVLHFAGRVFAIQYDDGIEGPARVWLKNVDIPGIAMSRSLGDKVAHRAGCISTPDFTRFDLKGGYVEIR